MRYTVQPGDTLAAIAARFYGDPAAFDRIAQANLGHPMPDGATFVDPGLIRPGWQLAIPQPTRAVVERDGQPFYTVERGDSLRAIAARLLGDSRRWSELYALNLEAPSGPGQGLGADPDLIMPGQQLRLPSSGEVFAASGAALPQPAAGSGGGEQP